MRQRALVRAGTMFGLAVDGSVAVHGLAAADGSGGRHVELRRTSRAAIELDCPRERGVPFGGVGTGRRAVLVTMHRERGFVWRAPGFGLFRVAIDGSSIDCGPTRGPAWWWQRMLIGQALPHAALIHGLEVLHAGAIAGGDGAIALTGESGAGKSTLVAALVEQGAGFLADDVVAVEPGPGEVLAHPGAAVMSLGPGAGRGLRARGRVIGADDEGERIEVPRVGRPLPLRAVVVLTRGGAGGLRELDGDPRPLLEANFNHAVLDRERLERRLDVCTRIATSARLLRLRVDDTVPPSRTAATILERLG